MKTMIIRCRCITHHCSVSDFWVPVWVQESVRSGSWAELMVWLTAQAGECWRSAVQLLKRCVWLAAAGGGAAAAWPSWWLQTRVFRELNISTSHRHKLITHVWPFLWKPRTSVCEVIIIYTIVHMFGLSKTLSKGIEFSRVPTNIQRLLNCP